MGSGGQTALHTDRDDDDDDDDGDDGADDDGCLLVGCLMSQQHARSA